MNGRRAAQVSATFSLSVPGGASAHYKENSRGCSGLSERWCRQSIVSKWHWLWQKKACVFQESVYYYDGKIDFPSTDAVDSWLDFGEDAPRKKKFHRWLLDRSRQKSLHLQEALIQTPKNQDGVRRRTKTQTRTWTTSEDRYNEDQSDWECSTHLCKAASKTNGKKRFHEKSGLQTWEVWLHQKPNWGWMDCNTTHRTESGASKILVLRGHTARQRCNKARDLAIAGNVQWDGRRSWVSLFCFCEISVKQLAYPNVSNVSASPYIYHGLCRVHANTNALRRSEKCLALPKNVVPCFTN